MRAGNGMTLDVAAERRPEVARDAFNRLDEALNAILPGSDTHKRYDSADEVGLAVVIGGSEASQSYSPLDSATPARLSFMGDNQSKYPDAWTPKETDTELLGGRVPEGIGRFTAFALAKINTLAMSDGKRLTKSRHPNLNFRTG